MLTYEQIKAMEDALGPEKARPVVEAFQSTDTRVMVSLLGEIATKADLANLRTEFKQDLAELRMEFKQDLAELRMVFKQDLANLRTEFKQDLAELRTEFKQDIAGLRTELKQDLADFRTEFKQDLADLRTDLKGDNATLRTDMEVRFGSIDAKLARLDIMIKVLIALTALAVAFFSPVAEKLITVLF